MTLDDNMVRLIALLLHGFHPPVSEFPDLAMTDNTDGQQVRLAFSGWCQTVTGTGQYRALLHPVPCSSPGCRGDSRTGSRAGLK